MLRFLLAAGALALVAVGGLAGWRLVETHVALEVHRDRLEALAQDYETLRARYDEAVARTAVTEILVADGRLAVRIRTLEGVVETIETPLDPSQEIYVDYVVIDGRLWIRRIFDGRTPPVEGVVIDPTLAGVDWSAEGAAHGKAVYRELGPGRWVVTVSGDGALALARADEAEPVALAAPPPIQAFEPLEPRVKSALGALAPGEVAVALRDLLAGEPTR